MSKKRKLLFIYQQTYFLFINKRQWKWYTT